VDLDVTYIEMVRPDGSRWTIDDPNGGWPRQGEVVLFRGHVANKGDRTAGSFCYTWAIDGQVLESGQQDGLEPNAEIALSLNWTWPMTTSADGRIAEHHLIRLDVALESADDEISLANNSIEDVIGALTVGFWVERSVYDFYNQNQFANCLGKPCAGSNSWEDWAQRNLRKWNEMLANASPPLFDRVRLDKVVVVPDGALPLTSIPEGKATNTPDPADRTVDMMLGFPAADLRDLPFQMSIQDWDPGLIHELVHARGLPDMYALNVHRSRDVIQVTDEQGRSAWDYFPPQDLVYTAKYEDLMSALHLHFFALYSAYAFKALEGQRNWGINYNPPYDDDFTSPPESWRIILVTSNLPRENRLRILDRQGKPLSGACVKLYQMSSPRNKVWYAKTYDNVADIAGTTNEEGIISLGHNPFGPTFFTGSMYCAGDCVAEDNWLPLVAISYGGRTEFHFLEHTDFNLAYWQGQREVATYEIRTALGPFCVYLPVVVGAIQIAP